MHILQKICLNCHQPFETSNKKAKFCSNKCASIYNAKLGKVGGNYTSLEKFVKRYGQEDGTKRYKNYKQNLSKSLTGHRAWNLGKLCSQETKLLIAKKLQNSQYHINRRGKALSQEAKDQISNTLKGVFTLSWFTEKFGETEGTKKYEDRVRHISETSFFRKYNKLQRNNFSIISQRLFWQIYNDLKNYLEKEKVYFAELNHEYSCRTGRFNYDFVNETRKKVIEFNGNAFHANPSVYKADDIPIAFLKAKASQLWDFDKRKNERAIQNGYEVFVVWEQDFIDKPEEVILSCENFLGFVFENDRYIDNIGATYGIRTI